MKGHIRNSEGYLFSRPLFQFLQPILPASIGEDHEDHSMESMDDPQDFFAKVDDPRELGVTGTPLRVAPGSKPCF